MNLSDRLRIGRRTDEGDASGIRDDRRRCGRLDGRAVRQRERGVTITHLIRKHPTEETRGRCRSGVEGLQLRGIIWLLRTASVAAIRTDVVVIAFPAAPDPHDRILERVRTWCGDRGDSRIIVEGGGGGNAGVRTEAFLECGARQADGTHGIEPSDGFGLLDGSQRGLDLEEGGEHDDHHHHHGHDDHG